MVRIGDICIINPKAQTFDEDYLVSFVPMPKVGENGEFDASDIKEYREVKKGFTYFQNGDVLFAKITPCMENGKGAIARNLKNGIGFGSTEFHVLRPIPDVVLGEWLYYLLSWTDFRKEAEKNMTGSAGQKRVPKSFLENYQVVVPSLDIQEKQVNIFKNLDLLISLRKQQLSKLDELVKSRFVEIFGLPGSDVFGWGVVPLGSVCDINPKKSQDPRLCSGMEVSFVPMPAVTECGEIDATAVKEYDEVKTGFTYFAENDVLFAKITPCMENGKGAVAKGLHNGLGFGSTEFHVLRPISGKTNPYWVYTLTMFSQFREDAARNMTGSAGQRRVPASFLENYRVAIPPIELQEQFEAFVEQTNKSKFEIQKSLEKLETLKKALMQKYFG